MAHFAEIDENNIVKRVIVADQEFIDSGVMGNPSRWVQTSYNTKYNKHKIGGVPLRGNFASIGYTYDPQKDVFLPPKKYASWILNETDMKWEAPVKEPAPKEGVDAVWDEQTLSWKEVPRMNRV